MNATESDDAGAEPANREPRASAIRWLALLSPLVVPWLVVRTGGTTLLFPWGTVVVETGHVAPITAFLGGPRPRHVELWPLAVACYGAAIVWAAAGRFVSASTDERVTAGLFVLVAVATAWMASGFGVDPNRTAVPIGSIHAVALAVWLSLTGGRR